MKGTLRGRDAGNRRRNLPSVLLHIVGYVWTVKSSS